LDANQQKGGTMVHARPVAFPSIAFAVLSGLAACGVRTDREAAPPVEGADALTASVPEEEMVSSEGNLLMSREDGSEPLGEAADEFGAVKVKLIDCKGRGLNNVDCMVVCAEAGIPCPAGLKHPRKSDGGQGDLFRCSESPFLGRTCSYSYENGDVCFLTTRASWAPCLYPGGVLPP
jgi:hypothetical protein